jgi:hypothetical protein
MLRTMLEVLRRIPLNALGTVRYDAMHTSALISAEMVVLLGTASRVAQAFGQGSCFERRLLYQADADSIPSPAFQARSLQSLVRDRLPIEAVSPEGMIESKCYPMTRGITSALPTIAR